VAEHIEAARCGHRSRHRQGVVRVHEAERRPHARWLMPVLARRSMKSKMAVPVVSLPVPAVVGMAMRGRSGFVRTSPAPTGAIDEPQKVRAGVRIVEVGRLARIDNYSRHKGRSRAKT